jgi:hypothetical protein
MHTIGFCGSANKGHLLYAIESLKASGHFEKWNACKDKCFTFKMHVLFLLKLS